MRWTAAASRADFGARDVIGVECGGRRIALYRIDGEILATSDVCPHQGASLSEGCLVSGHIECPAHHALFDIRTGASDGALTMRSVKRFATRVENGVIHVELPGIGESDQ